jgi:chromosome segregation ATPase
LTQPWKQDVDAPEAINQLPTRSFDVNGMALSPQLRQGAASEFQAGDKIELDYAAAQALINQGIAKPVETIYRRPLRDYAYQLSEVAREVRELNERARLTDQANKTIQQAIDKAKRQIAVRTDEKAKLTEDRQHVIQERDAMQQYLTLLQKEYDVTLANLRETYAKNLELVDRLRRLEQAVINAIQQQLASAPAAP